jgi:TRAP-type C4-dicarboxylate transport system substrate-binding protein
MRVVIAALLVMSSVAFADETVRIATIAPDGTSWARSVRAMVHEVENATGGNLHFKVYFGGIAGDEIEMLERVRRGQLDGVLSGGIACETLAPSLRVVRIPGVFQTWNETSFVLGKLRTVFEDEVRRNGFTYLGEAIVGPPIPFTRKPVSSLADLRTQRLWIWDTDQVLRVALPDIGMNVVPLPIRDALRAYEAGQTDGFITPAVVTLGFQWSTAVRYYADLRLGFVVGCLIVANRTFDALPLPTQQAMRVAAAHMKARFEEEGRAQEEQLLHGLLEKQGLQAVHVGEQARLELFEATRAARDKLGKLVPQAVLVRVLGLLADYRNEHRGR